MWTDRGARAGVLLGTLAILLATTVVGAVSPGVPAAAQDGQVEGLAEARERATAAAAALADLESELGELDATIAAATAEAEAAEQAADALAEQVRRLAVDRYMQVDDVPVLPGGDINARERARVLVATVAGHNLDAMDRYRAERQRLDDARATADTARAAQSERLAEMEDRRAVLAAELARLEALEAERQEAVAAQAREEAARQATERQRASQTTTSTPAGSGGGSGGGSGTPFVPPPATGGWLCPVQGANSFIDSWMAPRAGGRWHQGVDIMSPRGTPVVLPVGGRVEFYTGGIGGLTFSLNGDDGNYYYGAHMDAYAGLAPGWYPAGTLVGYVGETGDARGTAPHLHFEIHLGGYGNAVNPYPTTRAHC
jgi:murein DD-endopeptidase MepM/ murein hydrolase activator NlpD